jgi:hypothetical protein
MRRILIALLLLLAPAVAAADSCTDGTSCFCDTAIVTGDSARLACLDWEEITYSEGRGTGTQGLTGGTCAVGNASSNCAGNTGSPLYGPVYDDTLYGNGTRSSNYVWYRNFGSSQGGAQCALLSGSPASPTYGRTRTPGNPAGDVACEWDVSDSWQCNSVACMDFIRSGEWDDEVAGDLAPLLPDGSRGGYGDQTFAYRNRSTGINSIIGEKSITATSEVGITMFLAYSTGAASSNIWNQPWKHLETGPSGNAPIAFFNNSGDCGKNTIAPLCMFFFVAGGTSACNTAKAAATTTYGNIDCTSGTSVRFNPVDGTGAHNYRRTNDWNDLNQWACLRAHYTGVGTSNMGVEYWITVGGAAEKKLIQVTGFDGTILTDGVNAINSIKMDSYSNHAYVGGTLTQTVRRYEENIYFRSGTPLTCAEAGFYESGGAPADPTIGTSVPTLAPSVTAGGTATAQTFTVSNSGAGTLAYQVTEATSWLSVSPGTGTSTGEADTITVTYATSGLAAGTYTGTITVADNSSSPAATNSPQTVVVTLTVNPSGTARTLRGRRML